MAWLIQKSGYIKNGKASGYMEYVATRDGVEIIQSTEPVTKKQEQFIKRLLKDFPDAKELFEHGDYKQTPNRGTASAFIATALDTHLHEMESESGYMSYIAQRPRAEKHGGHGLFSTADTTDLKAAKAELEAHNGKVWTFIFSLRREDAERLGYNKAAAWRNLLKQESASIAEAMRIQTDDLRWYAAYHDEGHHPHVHMMVWSDDPKMGFLAKKGIFAMRSKLTGTIFREELKDVYIRKESIYKRSIQTVQDELLNAVIREAEHIRLTEDPTAKTAEQAPFPSPVVVEQPRDMTTAQNISMLPATLRLLHHLGNIFHHDSLISPITLRIDSKRRRRLQEKRMAMGHKRDDHEEQERLRKEQIL